MNLELFKTLTEEQLKIYGESVPEGAVRDAHGNMLTWKNSDGDWCVYTRDADGNMLTWKNSDGDWEEYVHDAKGNVLTRKDSNGDWEEYVHDAKGNVLTCKDSNGFWCEYTRDADGNELTYKSSYGQYQIKDKLVTREEFEAFVNSPKTKELTIAEIEALLGHQVKIVGGNK